MPSELPTPTVRWLDINPSLAIGTVFNGLVSFYLSQISRGRQVGLWEGRIKGTEIFSYGPFSSREEAKDQISQAFVNLLTESYRGNKNR